MRCSNKNVSIPHIPSTNACKLKYILWDSQHTLPGQILVRQPRKCTLNLTMVQLADGSFTQRGMSLSSFLNIARSLCHRKLLDLSIKFIHCLTMTYFRYRPHAPPYNRRTPHLPRPRNTDVSIQRRAYRIAQGHP